MSDVLTVGELLAEFMAERVGQTFCESGTFLGPYPSGAPAIFADQVAKTGTSAAMVGWVGEDGFGDLILDRLRGDGVDVSGIHRADRLPTGTAFVTYRNDGSREFIFNLANSATSLIDADSVDVSLTDGCRFFHVMGTSLTSEGMIAAVRLGIQRVKKGGGRVSFDPNIRREVMSSDFIRDAIDFVLKECDILLPSEADLRYFCGNLAEADAVHQLFDKWTLERVVVKNAAQGSTYYDRAQSIHVPSFKVTEVDPTGAGDCFGGTLISCLAQGIDLERTLTLANAAGALAVTKRGPMEGNTTLSELEPFIASAERTTL
jgi:fructokinase